jgi:hypothetical protein
MRSKQTVLVLLLALMVQGLQARENIGMVGRHSSSYQRLANDCNDATAQVDLDINNVRARLLGAGDFWWDLNDAVYVVPKVDPATGEVEVSSMFAGALWLGGIDAGGQLKIAAQTYRQSGNDFWPGPLADNGSTDQDQCNSYDRHWKVTRVEIDDHIENAAASTPIAISNIPEVILEWPARGNPYARGKNNVALTIDRNLAPYVDFDGDGIYDPTLGDYPDVDGDQAIFWVYNDRGNIHTETGGDAIGVEIQAVAFGFQTSDEINDMTFYRYNVLNFGTSPLDSTFFGQWVDADLGAFDDDFVGCDTATSLGMCYNGDAVDGPTSPNYGDEPPVIGTDFFQGPKKFFEGPEGLDSVLLGMSAFLFYNNDFSVIGNPEIASHFYGYLTGTWKDGSPFTEGGNGYGGSEPSNFLFPDDPGLPLPAWSECSEGNDPFDRRYLQSSGPFTLQPGAKNEVVVGVVWVSQGNQAGCAANFNLIKAADEKAQALFDSDFQLLDGPDAPDIVVRELDEEIVLSLVNKPTGNNANEDYEETDPVIRNIVLNDATGEITDSTYNFEGYIIYQLENALVSGAELDDPALARVVAQVDLKNEVSKLVNFTFDTDLGADVPVLEVDGNDDGILHTFRIQEDLFAEDDKRLINHKTYYFTVIAYAYNNFKDYDPSDPNTQKLPYLQGRKNVKTYTAIPHIPTPENGGTVLGSSWGDGPEVIRVEGSGNGGNDLALTTASEENVLANNFDANATYQGRRAPVDVMVADPLKVPAADFTLTFSDSTLPASGPLDESATWLLESSDGRSWSSQFGIGVLNQQLIEDIGLSITATQVNYPGNELEDENGLIDANIDFEVPSNSWLGGLQDFDGSFAQDWIAVGLEDTDRGGDEDGVYEGVLTGSWTPGKAARIGGDFAPINGFGGLAVTMAWESTHSIDVVLTSDKSKWTRSAVVETSEDGLAPVEKSQLKPNASVDQDGNPDGTGTTGFGWFPGYAVDLETGTRLNIVFGEATWLAGSNGNDMIWNPTDELYDPLFNPRFGGGHIIYVMSTEYDEGLGFAALMNSGGTVDQRNAWRDCMWVGYPLLNRGFDLLSVSEGLIPTTTRVSLRVTQPLAVLPVDGSNQGINKYRFSTVDLAATTGDVAAAETACDLINVVPNPYYAFSSYETSALDNRIKITNLPSNCQVSIYTLEGTLVRRLNRDVNSDQTSGGILNAGEDNLDTSLDWDLKNEQNIPVASGIYLIHVEAEGLCERTLKWLGVMRPVDLDTF